MFQFRHQQFLDILKKRRILADKNSALSYVSNSLALIHQASAIRLYLIQKRAVTPTMWSHVYFRNTKYSILQRLMSVTIFHMIIYVILETNFSYLIYSYQTIQRGTMIIVLSINHTREQIQNKRQIYNSIPSSNSEHALAEVNSLYQSYNVTYPA